MSVASPAATLERLVRRFDSELFWPMRPDARIRLCIGDGPQPSSVQDVVFEGDRAFLVPCARRPDALLTADQATWERVRADVRGGLKAFQEGRLTIRRDLHLGIGFLAATASPAEDRGGATSPGLRFRQVRTGMGEISINEAGSGPPAILVHGLGATKVSLLPTLAALAGEGRRAIALDLPGFGDSGKPIGAPYHAPYFARAVVSLMDALGIERADLIGNSLGGRVALEVGLRFPQRARRLGLLAPSLAWLRGRPWAPLLRLISPQIGLLQPAPRAFVEGIVRTVVGSGGASGGPWTAAGVDEFLRSYLTPRGRAAFYAAARQIYLEPPHGPHGLWTRLASLGAPSLFVWGRQDTLVPIGFQAHVRRTVPAAEHLELECGHVPQLERPQQTHRALLRFLAAGD
jgi:pimeloyl-ACP methyl ester carboxylesterase